MSSIVIRALAAAAAAATLICLNPLTPAQATPVTSAGAARPTCVAPASTTTTQFTAHDEPGNQAFDDLGAPSPDGPDIGDLIAFTQTLTRNGKTAGLVHVAAVVVDHQRHLSQASGSIELPQGVIEVAGIVTQTPTFTLAVTGGTGPYTGATGQLSFHLTDTTQTLTLRLTVDPSTK
jgi:hypothetical protein